MSKRLLRAAMALGIAALALSFTEAVRAQDTNTPPAPATTTAPAAKPKAHQYTGEVASIDGKAGVVVVKKGSESKTFKVGEKTRYSTAETPKGALLADIKVGDKVTVRYIEEDGVLIAHSIGVPQSVKKQESSQ